MRSDAAKAIRKCGGGERMAGDVTPTTHLAAAATGVWQLPRRASVLQSVCVSATAIAQRSA